MADRGTRSRTPTHAGAVVYRMTTEGPEYLLIEGRKSPGEWVLPKGHLEPDEAEPETAARETHEEAGVKGVLGPSLGVQELVIRGQQVRVSWWLLEARGEEASPEGRRKQWGRLDDALAAVRHEGLRELLRRAHARITSAPFPSSRGR